VRRPLATALLFALAAALSCGAAELLLRRLGEATVGTTARGERKEKFNPYRPDATLGYALRPGWSGWHAGPGFRVAVRVNGLGLRGPERDAAKPRGSRRVLVVGDSFAFGWGVEETEAFPARLERRWRERGDADEVLDAAVPGWAAPQHLVWLRERGFALDPDLLVLASCQNDPDDLAALRLALAPDRLPLAIESESRFIAEDGRMHYLNRTRLPLPPRLPFADWLAERSVAFTYVRYNGTRLWLGVLERVASARGDANAPSPDAPVEALAPEAIAGALDADDAFRRRYHDFVAGAIRREATRRGVAFVEVVTGDAPGPLSDGCARSDACLDLATALARETHGDAYLEQDGHWSPRGHARAADALDAWLGARQLP
jgi:hypothetical protein